MTELGFITEAQMLTEIAKRLRGIELCMIIIATSTSAATLVIALRWL